MRNDVNITIRLSEEEKWNLQDYARTIGLTMSSLIRLALREYFEKRGIYY